MVTRDRIDLAHPACVAFLADGSAPEGEETALVVTETALTPAEVAARTGRPLAQVTADMSGPLAAAVIPVSHLSLEVFAWLAGVPITVVLAVDAELEPAVAATGRIDLAHGAALEFLAARPFKRKRNGDPADCPEGFLAPADLGDDNLDSASPFFRAWLARLDGVAPTDESVAATFGAAAAQ
jgi:hypothetical protein